MGDIDIRTLIQPNDPYIISLANQLQTLENIYHYVRDEIASIPDEQEDWQSAQYTIKRNAGDCEDKSVLLCSLLRALNYDAIVYVFYNPQFNENHCVVLVMDKDITMDSTFDTTELGKLADVFKYGYESCPIMTFCNEAIHVYDQKAYEDMLTSIVGTGALGEAVIAAIVSGAIEGLFRRRSS